MPAARQPRDRLPLHLRPNFGRERTRKEAEEAAASLLGSPLFRVAPASLLIFLQARKKRKTDFSCAKATALWTFDFEPENNCEKCVLNERTAFHAFRESRQVSLSCRGHVYRDSLHLRELSDCAHSLKEGKLPTKFIPGFRFLRPSPSGWKRAE